jgi:hypothetical protein
MKDCIVIEGDPVDGFTFTGPFKDVEDAIFYGEGLGVEWWIGYLNPVELDTLR